MLKMFKKLTGTVLAATVAASLLPVAASADNGDAKYITEVLDNYSLAQKYDTSVFEGEHVYLLEDNFLENSLGLLNSDAMPAGWDVDRRAGRLRGDGTRMCILDGNDRLGISMKHKLMTHKKGDLVLETAILMKWAYHDGYSIKLNGAGQDVAELVTKGNEVCFVNSDGTLTPIGKYIIDKEVPVRVVVHPETGTADVSVNGESVYGLKLKNNTGVIDEVELKTSEEAEMTVAPVYVHVYINHFVNERFLSSPEGGSPYDWDLNVKDSVDTGVAIMESQRVDVKSFKLSGSRFAIEPELSREFKADVNKLVTEFYALIPEKRDGIKMSLMSGSTEALTISTKGQGFVVNNSNVIYEDYKSNLWNRFKIITDYNTKTADIYLNYNLAAQGIPVNGKLDKISFKPGTKDGAVLWVDDILVYEGIDSLKGYPEAPQTVEPKEGYNVGMLMYSMWREGFHFGWDRMSPYEERTPYMGFYTEGMAETADWETKWLAEHGVNFQIFTFSGVPRNTSTPIKKPTRSQALIDGLLAGKYKMDFCIMWSTPTEQTIRGLDDFKNNILPYWVENFFKNPNYKTVDNKLLVYSYSTGKIMDCLGGQANLETAISLMNEEAKKLGFDGVLFVQEGNTLPAETVEKCDIYRYNYAWGDSSDDADAVIKSTVSTMETGTDRRYIPSIGQGFNTTPWRVGSVGFMTPEETDKMLAAVVQNSDKWVSMGNKMAKTVTLTCWNEWGEGHFYGPSKLHGFDYVNSIRNNFTDSGVKEQENFPTEQSYVRMNVLYPIGRQGLKHMQDQVSKELDESQLVLLARYDFSKPEDYARLEIEKSVSSMENANGMLVGASDARDPSIFINDVNIDATKAKIVKVNAAQENGSTFTIYYQTTEDTAMGVNGKRFAGALAADKTLTPTGATLVPADSTKLKGTITRLRIDPDDMVMGKFAVQSVEVWGTETGEIGLYIDGAEYFNNTPLRQLGGVSYMSINKYFWSTLMQNIVWDRPNKHLHLDTFGNTVDMYDGSTAYTVNGEQRIFTNAPFYADGNFFVPVREFFEAIGYTVGWDGEKGAVTLQSPGYAASLAAEKTPLQWEFDLDNYLDGWTLGDNYRGWRVDDGILRISSRAQPLTITANNLGIKESPVKYAVIRIKNTSEATQLRLFFTNDKVSKYGADGRYYVSMEANTNEFKEYVVNLSDSANFNGNINSLRLDVVTNDGSAEIDYIRFVEEVN